MAIPNAFSYTIPYYGTQQTDIYNGGGTRYIIETNIGKVYAFYKNSSGNPVFITSLDRGRSWSTATSLKNIILTQMAVWYDRWTDPTGAMGDLIHVVYTDLTSDDVYYRSINTANSDTLSTEYTVFAGGSAASGAAISIARMIGGNLVCCGCIDAGTEIFSRKSTDVGVNWSDIAAVQEASGNADQLIVMPGWGADTNDAMIFYYDRSATEISVKYYDDSANSVSETSLATSVTIPDHTNTTFGHFAASVDHTNSANIVVFWNAVDTANADLKCFSCTQSAQTAKTDVVLNSTDDQGFCAITIKGTTWTCYYAGKSDGSEVYNSCQLLYYKSSTDGGSTWGTETKYDNSQKALVYLATNIINYSNHYLFLGVTNGGFVEVEIMSPYRYPRTTYQLGI